MLVDFVNDDTPRPRPIEVHLHYTDIVYLTATEGRADAARYAAQALVGFIRTAQEAGEDPAEWLLRNEFLTLKEGGSDVVDSRVVETQKALESAQ